MRARLRRARARAASPIPSSPCPPPLAPSPLGCDAPDVRVLVPETTLVLGPSDWEAEGRVTPRTIHAGAFRIDAFEVTLGRWGGRWGGATPGDAARAASGMTADEAAAFCARQAPGGRLPTEDEWIVAAVSGTARTAALSVGRDRRGLPARRVGARARARARKAPAGPTRSAPTRRGDSALGSTTSPATWPNGSALRASAAKGGSWASDPRGRAPHLGAARAAERRPRPPGGLAVRVSSLSGARGLRYRSLAPVPMTCVVLSIGTELTRGELVNSNAAWLAAELTAIGFEVSEHAVVDDDVDRIVATLRRLAPQRARRSCRPAGSGRPPTT